MDKKEFKIVLEELDEKPYHKFNVVFSLMSILPFLVIFYILVGEIFSLDFLSGKIGLILFITIFISICGYCVGYKMISKILERTIFYAAKAKHSDQLKSKLVASVSHEFKNPLGALRLCIFDMTEGILDKMSESQKEMLNRCNNIIDRLGRLVNDLLDIYKIEAGMVEMNRKLCNLSELLEKQIREFENILSKNKIKINIIKESKDGDFSLWADENKITLIINNLLSNAVKYTSEGGLVTVKISCLGELLRLELEDTGRGIPKEKIGKIFDKFEKLDTTQEGSGIGLAIVKDVVEAHGGRVWAVSELGEGSRFVIILPRSLR